MIQSIYEILYVLGGLPIQLLDLSKDVIRLFVSHILEPTKCLVDDSVTMLLHRVLILISIASEHCYRIRTHERIDAII